MINAQRFEAWGQAIQSSVLARVAVARLLFDLGAYQSYELKMIGDRSKPNFVEFIGFTQQTMSNGVDLNLAKCELKVVVRFVRHSTDSEKKLLSDIEAENNQLLCLDGNADLAMLFSDINTRHLRHFYLDEIETKKWAVHKVFLHMPGFESADRNLAPLVQTLSIEDTRSLEVFATQEWSGPLPLDSLSRRKDYDELYKTIARNQK